MSEPVEKWEETGLLYELEDEEKSEALHKNLKKTLNFKLMEREFPFHWRMQELPATLYQGNPHVARPRKIDVPESLVSSSKKAVMEVVSHEHDPNSDARPSCETRDKSERFWNAVSESLRDRHENDNMISFYVFNFRDDEFFIRYYVIE